MTVNKEINTILMRKNILDLIVSDSVKLNERYTLLKLTHDSPLPRMYPGQFVEVKVDDSPRTMLRRPISVNYVDYESNELWLLVAAVGDGTRHITSLHVGDILNCVLPLGNGFRKDFSTGERILLVGGGVGVAPLLYYGKCIKDQGATPVFLLGARSSRDLLEMDCFRRFGDVHITTEDGSAGEKGFVTNHSCLSEGNYDFIATCGPKPMMKAVAKFAASVNLECEVSLENMMACAVGACLCCVEKTTSGNLCVCKDGPVFKTSDLLWDLC